jgi:hypothetical protein
LQLLLLLLLLHKHELVRIGLLSTPLLLFLALTSISIGVERLVILRTPWSHWLQYLHGIALSEGNGGWSVGRDLPTRRLRCNLLGFRLR